MNVALIGLISAVGGGLFVKVLEIIFLPKSKQADIATQIRDELREDIAQSNKKIEALSDEVDYWKKSYFRLIEMLIKNNVDIPDYLFEPYRRDPSTPDVKPKKV